MIKATTGERLLEWLNEHPDMRQADIIRLAQPYCEKYDVPLKRQDVNQYIKKGIEPRQDKLFIMAKALNVTEAWLMGLDVPRGNPQKIADLGFDLIEKFTLLEQRDRRIVLDLINSMLSYDEGGD